MCFWWKAVVRLRLHSRSRLLKVDLTEACGAGTVFREYLGQSGGRPTRRTYSLTNLRVLELNREG